MEDSAWYSHRETPASLAFSFHLVRSAVLVLNHLEVIVTRRHPGDVRRWRSPGSRCQCSSWPAVDIGPSGNRTGPPPKRRDAARDRLMLIVQRGAASYYSNPAPLPVWFVPQAIKARLPASCGLPHPDVSAAILILQNLGVIECSSTGQGGLEIAGASLPIVCYAATGRADAYDRSIPW